MGVQYLLIEVIAYLVQKKLGFSVQREEFCFQCQEKRTSSHQTISVTASAATTWGRCGRHDLHTLMDPCPLLQWSLCSCDLHTLGPRL